MRPGSEHELLMQLQRCCSSQGRRLAGASRAGQGLLAAQTTGLMKGLRPRALRITAR